MLKLVKGLRYVSEERIVTTSNIQEDFDIDTSLRPKAMKDYIGQEAVKENLYITIEAARQRREALDHVLLYGPPGLSKPPLHQLLQTKWA